MSSSNQQMPAPPSLSEESYAYSTPDVEQSLTPNAVAAISFDPEKTDGFQHPIAEAAEAAGAGEQPGAAEPINVLQEVSKAAAGLANDAAANVSKAELAKILEGFAQVLRADPSYSSVTYADHMGEITQLKALLLEAQETIINLLNDRVYDRAKLARLEAEVRFLPDLQAQANRAMNLAQHSESVQAELAHVRSEVERLRTSYMRTDKSTGWFGKIFKK